MRVLFGLLVVALLSVTCTPSESARDDAGAPVAPAAHHPKLAALEKHLRYNTSWGSDPIAKRIAEAVHDALRDVRTASHDIAVAATIVASSPRQIVVVAQVKTLKEDASTDRSALVESVREAIKDGLAPSDEVTLGVKGPSTYAVVAQGTAAARWATQSARGISAAPLGSALARPPAPAARTEGKIGEPVVVADVEWTVISAVDKGRAPKPVGKNFRAPTTDGRFVVVLFKATSKAKRPHSIGYAPRVVDASGRELGTHPEQDMLVPDGGKTASWQELQPDVPVEFWAAYDVPKDAKGLRAKVRGAYEYTQPGFIDLAL